jgi:hypothetical protein
LWFRNQILFAMKSTTPFQLATFFMALAVSIVSCNKESPTTPAGGTSGPAVTNNKSPFANAGRDTTIRLPVDSVNLDGSASYDPDGTITNFLWSQISGDNAYIRDKQYSKTKAYWLIPGIYDFELKVTDNGGLSFNDTVKVTVLPPATITSPFLATNLTWTFPWYNTLQIPSIYSYVPQGRPFKVFVQRDYDATWIEAHPESSNSNNLYEYYIGNGSSMYSTGWLYIFYFGSDTNDTPNVKVEF